MSESKPAIKNILLDKLEIWEQANVRKDIIYDNLEELANNIKYNGIENPLLVRKYKNRYQIFAGQRRFLASQKIGLKSIPCRVYESISLQKAKSLSLSENVFSEKMTALDKANAVKELLYIHKDKKTICKILGIKTSTLQVYLSYHVLPSNVKQLISDGKINMQFALFVMRKFTQKSQAVSILNHISSMKKGSVQRTLFISAIHNSLKTDTLDDIKSNMKKIDSVSITIDLDVDNSKILQKLANINKTTPNNMASDLLQKRLRKISL